jgi:hypothetical protein
VSMLERPSRQQRRGSRRRSVLLRALLVAAALALAFLLGIAFARTLDERPDNGGTVTSVRTLTPLPQRGSVRTVTVTVTQP